MRVDRALFREFCTCAWITTSILISLFCRFLCLSLCPTSHHTARTIPPLCCLPKQATGNMGGKTWQQDEEELFWLELIPQSPEGLDPGHRIYSWKEVADVMHERLGSRGYRNYNHQLICKFIEVVLAFGIPADQIDEHFYQNCKSNHPSPRAKGFVRDYMQRRG